MFSSSSSASTSSLSVKTTPSPDLSATASAYFCLIWALNLGRNDILVVVVGEWTELDRLRLLGRPKSDSDLRAQPWRRGQSLCLPLSRLTQPTQLCTSMFGFLGRLFSSASDSPEATAQAKQLVESGISSSTVFVASKSYCPYCTRAKQLLSQLGADGRTQTVELDQVQNGVSLVDWVGDPLGGRAEDCRTKCRE